MTDEAVHISITIKVEEREEEFAGDIQPRDLEEGIASMAQAIGQEALRISLQEIDLQLAQQVPKSWQNVGTEERWLVSSLGATRYKRRIYLDEEQRRRKPMDELLGVEKYDRTSGRVKEMGASLACTGTYRLAADQLSWLIKTPISHSAVQRMVWATGNRIADGEEAVRKRVFEQGEALEAGKITAPVLYGESDGVWVHLQREDRKSTEVRVAILSDGRKQIGKDRFRLEDKVCVTAIGLNSEAWQEQVLRTAHLKYDLSQTKMLISGGDGNHWVRHSFDRLEVQQEFVLDQFHLQRAAQRAFHDREKASQVVKLLRTKGFAEVRDSLQLCVDQAEGKQKKQMKEFYDYVRNNQDVLLDLEHRNCASPAYLGAIEGNVDKLVVHRMKGRGCSWRLRGLRAMLALCRHQDALRQHAYEYLPLTVPTKSIHGVQKLEVEYAETLPKSMPILYGSDHDKPWVNTLRRIVHG
jgi:hypothetical protein